MFMFCKLVRSNENTLNFTIQFDAWPEQLSWTIVDKTRNEQIWNNSVNQTNDYERVTDSMIIDDGCFSVNVFDSKQSNNHIIR